MQSRSFPALRSRALVVCDQALLSGFSFLTTLLLLRGMGLEGFGMWALLGLGWLWALGLIQALISQPMQTLVKDRSGRRRARYLASCQRMATWVAALFAGVAFFVVLGVEGDGHVALAFAAFLLARSVQSQYRMAAFVAGQRQPAMISDGIGQAGGFLALLVLGPSVDWRLEGVFAVQAALWALAALYSGWCFEGRGARPLPLALVIPRHWAFGRWLVGMAAVRWLSSNAFLLAVAAQFGPATLGLLRGLQSVVGVVGLVFAAMESILPTSASLIRRTQGTAAAQAYLWRTGRFVLPIVLVLSGAVVWGADPILHWVLDGQVPPEAKALLMTLAVLPLATLGSTLLSILYRTLERTDALFLRYVVVALLVAGTAPWIVQSFGVQGAAWGVALQPGVLAVLLASRHRHIEQKRTRAERALA